MTKKALFDAYLEKGDKILTVLGKHKGLIVTVGLTASMLVVADNASSEYGLIICLVIGARVLISLVIFLWPIRKLIFSWIKKK